METSVTTLISLNLVSNWSIFSWSKRNMNRSEFLLSAGSTEQVALFWKIGAKMPSARAQFHDTRFLINRTGFMWRKAEILLDGSDAPPLALFTFSGIFGKGRLKFADGRKFTWTRTNVTGDEWGFKEPDGDVVVGFRKSEGMWTDSTWVKLGDRVVSMPDVSVLLIMGWFLILLMTFNEHGIVEKGGPPTYREFVR